MSTNIYPKDFPNNLKIARRRTNEPVIKEAKRSVNTIEKTSDEVDSRLQQIIDQSIRIGVED